MKRMKRLSLMIAVVLVFGLMLGPASAWAHTNYTAIPGTSTTFSSHLVVDNDSHIPALTVTYSVSAGNAVGAETDDGELAVLAGLTPALVKVNGTAETGTTTFTANQTTTAGTATDGVVNTTDKEYASNVVTLDFSDVSYPEPGVYRYVITQDAITETFVTADATPTRTVDVYVHDNNGTLEIAGYVMYSGTKSDGPSATATTADGKSVQYVNTVSTYDLTVSKTVSGNQGSRDKYFQFTITITGLSQNEVVDIVRTGMTAAPTANAATIYTAANMATANGTTTLTANASGTITYTVYLSHNESVQLLGIPAGAHYTVVEAAEDYSCTPPANAEADIAADTTVAFTNTRSGVVPTGVMLTVVPGVIIIGCGAAGLILFNRKKKEEE